MNLINKLRKIVPDQKAQVNNDLKSLFFSLKYHQWINEDLKLKRHIDFLISSIPKEDQRFFQKNLFIIMPSNGKLSCALSRLPHFHTILIFDDLIKILKSSSPDRALAVLAHELGHLYFHHSYKDIAPSKAQLEADQYAVKLGFREPLIDILSEFPSIDSTMRIRALIDH